MQYANVHPLIGNLCSKPEGGVDVGMYLALCETLSLDQALDLAEIDLVQRSWKRAATANAKLNARSKKRHRT